jgi:cytochrome c556
MKALTVALVLAVAVAASGFGTAIAQDALQVIERRQGLMKQQGRDIAAVKALLDDKGDQAAAQAGADDLLRTIPQIPAAFPQRTSSADYPGKTRAKPAIWAEWDKFTGAQQTALAKAQALDAAVKTGNKVTIQAAFDDMGRNGCGGCHTPFREPAQQ